MYKLDLPIDLKEQAAIERRRRLEKERQSRIFNNKHRLIGVSILVIACPIFYFNKMSFNLGRQRCLGPAS